MEQNNNTQRQQLNKGNEAKSNDQNHYQRNTSENGKREKMSRYQWNHEDKRKEDTSMRSLTGKEIHSKIHGYGSNQNRFGRIIRKPYKLDL